MRIGELARRTGLTVETLRFYEAAGVLGTVARDRSGYRVYDEQAYRILIVVQFGQSVGLRLKDMARVLGSRSTTPAARAQGLRRLIEERLTALHAEIAALQATVRTLEGLQSVKLDGPCLLPASFVDELVEAHEKSARRASRSRSGVGDEER